MPSSTASITSTSIDWHALFTVFSHLLDQPSHSFTHASSFLSHAFFVHSHEVMNMGGDLRYVTKEDIASFGGSAKRKAAWDVKSGWIGQFVSQNFKITHIQNGHTVFWDTGFFILKDDKIILHSVQVGGRIERYQLLNNDGNIFTFDSLSIVEDPKAIRSQRIFTIDAGHLHCRAKRSRL